MRFKDVIGQAELKKRLADSVNHNRLAHAYLFLGEEGTGGLPLGMAFAQLINCENPLPEDSCGVCNSCVKIDKLIHADVHYTFPIFGSDNDCNSFLADWRKQFPLTPYMSQKDWILSISKENKQGNINAKEITNIIKGLSLTNLEGKYKIQIIWGAELLGKEGNKLLKLLEEPPENTVFLLVAENSELILTTILSRTQVIKVPRIADDDIAEAMVEKMELSKDQSSRLAPLAEGNWSKAEELSGESDHDRLSLLRNFMNQSYSRKDIPLLLKTIDDIASQGREQVKLFLEYMLHLFRRGILTQELGFDDSGNDEQESKLVEGLAKMIKPWKADKLPKKISDSILYIERNGYGKLVLFNLSLAVRDSFG